MRRMTHPGAIGPCTACEPGYRRRCVGRLCAAVALLGLSPALAASRAHAAAGPNDRLVLYVPATEGGGLDQAAIAMKAALEAEGLAHEVEIVRRPGGSGLVGENDVRSLACPRVRR